MAVTLPNILIDPVATETLGNMAGGKTHDKTLSDIQGDIRFLANSLIANDYSAQNKDSGTISAGMACAVHTSGTGFVGACAADGTKPAVGLMESDTAPTFAGLVQTAGLLTLSDWTAVTGSATLSARALYFLDPTTPGMLTVTPPTTPGQVLQVVGVAVSTIAMNIDVERPILL